MPIRIVPDDENEQERDDQRNPNQDGNRDKPEPQPTRRTDTNEDSGGGMGSLLAFIPLLLGVFGRRPILLLVVVGIGALFYFKGGCSPDTSLTNNDAKPKINTGATFDPKIYDKAEVFEPLSDKNAMPERVSLERYAPQRRDQGQQGSCVGWGSAYAARTILESASTGQNPNQIAFSPAYLYNQISLKGCQGSYIFNAMKLMIQQGALPLQEFPYTDEECSRRPSGEQMARASQYKMRGAQRLTQSGDDQSVDFEAIKQNLAAGGPVVIGMNVTNSFTYDMFGRSVWQPTREDYAGYNSLGGHCMCVIGYDDKMEGGAFQIMNSWGAQWGQNGIGWVKYKDFMNFTQEAYGLYPMPKRGEAANAKFSCAVGLVENDTKKYIPLSIGNANLFKTVQPIKKGTKFKIEVKNNVECYTYVFGQETNGSSYVLFPYTAKHSPFCGITGYRLFPKSESLQADNIGNKDFMAIVVTKEPIDYQKLNNAINASHQPTYQTKLAEALNTTSVQGVRYIASGGVVSFETDTQGKNAAVMVIQIDKI